MKKSRTAGFAFLLSAALAACGGDGGGEEQSLSAPELRQQAEAICRKTQSQITALRQPDGINSLGYFLDQSIPILEEAKDRFDDLNPPEELAEDWDKFIDAGDESLEVARDLREAVDQRDATRAQTLFTELGSLNNEGVRIAQTLDLEACVAAPPSS